MRNGFVGRPERACTKSALKHRYSDRHGAINANYIIYFRKCDTCVTCFVTLFAKHLPDVSRRFGT